MSDKTSSGKRQNPTIPSGSTSSNSEQQLWWKVPRSSTTAFHEIRRTAVNCIQIASIACYSYTVAIEAISKAFEARESANRSTKLARRLTEVANMLRKQVQDTASAVCSDNQALAQLYVSAHDKTISFYNFLATIKPSEEETYYDKVSSDFLKYTASLDTTASSDGCDSLSLPQIKKVKSISELNDFYGNMIAVSDKMRKSKTIGSPRAPSPLLSKEDAENIQKLSSSNSTQPNGRSHKYALKKSNSSNSSISE